MIWDRITGDMGRSYSIQNSIRKTEKEKEENIWRRKKSFVGEKKIKEGKGEKYLEKEKNFFFRRRITEKEKEDNVWRRKIFFCEKKEKEEIFGKGKYFFGRRRRKI